MIRAVREKRRDVALMLSFHVLSKSPMNTVGQFSVLCDQLVALVIRQTVNIRLG